MTLRDSHSCYSLSERHTYDAQELFSLRILSREVGYLDSFLSAQNALEMVLTNLFPTCCVRGE